MPNNNSNASIKVTDNNNGNLLNVVDFVIEKKDAIAKLANEKKTPFYVLDQKALDGSVKNSMKTIALSSICVIVTTS